MARGRVAGGPGKRTLTEQLPAAPAIQRKADEVGQHIDAARRAAAVAAEPVQRNGRGEAAAADVNAAATAGVASANEQLPYLDQIQASFGEHDISHVRAQTGGSAAKAARELGATAYAVGDRIAFANTPDLHTAAHEAAHVVQQQAVVQLKGGLDGGAGDPYEQHADAVADAVVAGRSAEALLGEVRSGSSSSPAVQRKTEPEPFVATSSDNDGATAGLSGITAQEWMWTWGPRLTQKLGAYLEGTAFDLPTTFAVWKTGSSAAFAKAMWAPIAALTGKGQPYAALGRILAPDPLDPHINAGRDAAVTEAEDPYLGNPIQPRGTRFWAEPVVAEVGKIVTKRIIESLARVLPRWLAARNQLALSSEGPARTPDRDPKQSEVVPSHPIDPYVVAGLENQVTPFLKTYRKAHPEQKTLGDMHLGALQKVTYQWQHDQGAWNWVRVTSPPNATKDDVAFTLYGDATLAHTITDASPLFGISNVDDLGEPANTEYAKRAATAKQPPGQGDDPGIDAPEQQMQTATVLSDEVMIAQAAKTKPSGIAADEDGRKVILDRMNAGLQLFQMIHKQSETMPRGGYESLLSSAHQRLQARAFKVADQSTSMGLIVPWDGQTQAQNDLLTEAFNGISMAVKQYATFSSWPNSALAIQQVGWMYLKVAGLSEQATAAQEALASANQQSKLFPVTVMELLLAEIRKVLHTESGAKFDKKFDSDAAHDARTDLKEHETREAKLRLGLARVRDKLLQNQNADDDLEQLVEELTDLQTEVSLVADLDAMERAWQALHDDISYVGVITGANSDDVDVINGREGHDPQTNPSLRELHDDWQRIYARYRNGDKGGAIEELKEKRPKWTQLYADIGKLIKRNETKNKWVTFGLLVGIALITAGVGAYVEGAAAAAWGASSWATFAVTAGAEAATFTSMSYMLVEKDPTIGGFFLELGKSLVIFGALKGVASKYIQLVGKDVAGAADTMLVQFVSINTASLVEADVKKYARTHQHLTLDEVLEISKQNAIFTIASGLATVAARPGLEALRLTGEANTALSRVRTLKTGLRDVATQVENAKTTDTRKVDELIAKQRELLSAEAEALKALEKLASDPKTAKKAGIDDAMKEEIEAHRRAHDETAQVVKLATIVQYTEGSGPVRYVEHGARYDEVVSFWNSQDGAQVSSVPVDPQFGSRAYEITTKDGETFRLVERTAENAKAVTRSGLELDRSAGKDPAQAAEAADLARIRNGEPGKIRSEAELSSADVAKSMTAQLQKIKPGEIDTMLSNFPPDQQAHAREVLARASGFGKMESLDSVRDVLDPHLKAGKKLFTPGSGSLADNMAYLAGKGSFKTDPGKIPTTQTITDHTVVILDDVVLARIESDPVFAKSLVDHHAVLLEPRGFTEGLNMYNATSPEVIQARVQKLLERANALQAASGGTMSFDDAITAALDGSTQAALKAANPALTGQLTVVDPASHSDISSAALADQLNGPAGVTEAQIEAMLSKVAEADRALLREVLAQQAEVFSPRRIANELAAQHARIQGIAASSGVKPENVYFFIFEGNKSYGMMAMAHREATGTPVDHYINGASDLASRNLGPDTMLVVLDDVAGSGMSLDDASSAAVRAGYKGKIVVLPLVSTEMANQLFAGSGGLTSTQPNTTYLPGRVMQGISESPLYKRLTPAQQKHLEAKLGHLGWPPEKPNGLSVAFPYMAPDNNNAMFGDHLAKDFIMNNNRGASKSPTWNPK